MDALQSAFAVVVVIAALAPGMVYALVRTSIRGFRADDKSIDSRIAQALIVSLVLDALYLLVFGRWINSGLVTIHKESIAINNPVSLGLLLLVLGVAIPTACAFLLNVRFRKVWTAGEAKRKLRLNLPYRDVPASWDWMFTRTDPELVRVQLPDGRWIAGWYGPGSYISTYPEPRDIFLSHQYSINQKTGKIGAVLPSTSGVWFTIPDGAIVEFVQPNPPSK